MSKFGCILVIAVEDATWEPVPEGSQKLHAIRYSGRRRGWRPSSACARLPRRGLGQDPHRPAQTDVSRLAMPAPRRSISELRHRRRSVIGGDPADPPPRRTARFYPQLTRDLAVAVGDALLKAACVFMSEQRADAPGPFPLARTKRVPGRGAGRRQEARQGRAQLRFPAVGFADQQPRGDGALLCRVARVKRRSSVTGR